MSHFITGIGAHLKKNNCFLSLDATGLLGQLPTHLNFVRMGTHVHGSGSHTHTYYYSLSLNGSLLFHPKRGRRGVRKVNGQVFW